MDWWRNPEASARKLDCGFRGKADADTKAQIIGSDAMSDRIIQDITAGQYRHDIDEVKPCLRGDRRVRDLLRFQRGENDGGASSSALSSQSASLPR